MKARDVERRLQERLPLLTNRFTAELSVASVTPSGTTATAVTSTAHGLSTGQKVLMAGIDAPVGIVSITRSGTIATATTSVDHDLTQNYIDQPTVTLSGSTEGEFNGTFTLTTVPNRRTFTFAVADAGPTTATGSPVLDSPGLPFGYNGLVTITDTPTTTSFEYTLPQALTVAGSGTNMRVIVGVRIHAAITAERALRVMESKDLNNVKDGELSLFVVLGDVQASRDRNALNDGVSSAGASGDNRQQILQQVNCIVFQKVTKDTSGADAGDSMQEVCRYVIGSLAGWSPGDEWAVQSGNKLRFVSHGLLQYDGAMYAHNIEFQLLGDISNEDLQITPENVAFRDILMSMTNDQGVQVLSATVNLDDEPLGA